MTEKSLVGSVFERKGSSSTGETATFLPSAKSGFPQVQHRSKSVFGKRKEDQHKLEGSPLRNTTIVSRDRLASAPATPIDVNASRSPKNVKPDPNDWRQQISNENQRRVANMTEEEREQEIRDVCEQLGPGAREAIQKIFQSRKMKEGRDSQDVLAKEPLGANDLPNHSADKVRHSTEILAPVPLVTEVPKESSHKHMGSPPPALSTSSTRPSSRADRKLRFAEVGPNDIHVYESAPPSPRKKAIPLPPPDPSDTSVVSLGQVKNIVYYDKKRDHDVNSMGASDQDPDGIEEGTPEYIRRRFFPNAPTHDPSVAWMESNSSSQPSPSPLRFDLTGLPIPPSLSSTLPTHLGLHHHAEGAHAGYTLDDIFLLCRSTVPAQRATMLAVLARIAHRLGSARESEAGVAELAGQENELRRRILAAGLEAMREPGGVGVRAVEVIWQCIVEWDEDALDIEGIEIRNAEGNSDDADAISFVPVEIFLPQVVSLLAEMTLPYESQLQLLAVLHRLAQHSNEIASSIVATPNLISSIIRIFILTPMLPTPTSMNPQPSAIQLLKVLAASSRNNAMKLSDMADSLMCFVTLLPTDAPYPPSLAVTLLIHTLHFYTVLASYGLYAHISIVAAGPLSPLRSYVTSSISTGSTNALATAWATLLQAWTTCAIDPHQTTPTHDILWSQVVAMGWSEDLLAWRESMPSGRSLWEVWTAVWQAQAAFLEGARVNGVNFDFREQQSLVEAIKIGFEDGKEHVVMVEALDSFYHDLEVLRSDMAMSQVGRVAQCSQTVAAAIQLWLACVPTSPGERLASPPFLLPFPRISEICAQLINHPVWSIVCSEKIDPRFHVACRSLTTLLHSFLGLSKLLPDVSDELWIAQALSILCRSMPGDEDNALCILEQVMTTINSDWMSSRGWHVPVVIWEKNGLDIIKPFLINAIRAPDTFIGPLWLSSRSISLSTTQRLPAVISFTKRHSLITGFPLAKDWILSPLDHLLRSGNSSIFRSLPSSWDASETEVTRASLLFLKITQTILRSFSLSEFMLTREEVVFGCMKVFMLEHDQHEDNTLGQVFRDGIVSQLMNDLLAPFTVFSGYTTPESETRNNLERVALRFLGPNMPFYQFYTDFVGLYDSISFAHGQFSRLLLPPTSMRYPGDYRKLLWDDFSHVLRTVRLSPDLIVAADLKEYLWPVEQDPQIIRSFLHSLLKQSLSGFVRLIAIHHVACNIWPDLQSDRQTADERSKKLLQAVLDMGSYETVREVVTYHQRREEITLPPGCFEGAEDWKTSRMEYVKRWGGLTLHERLVGLFTKTT